MNFFSVFNVIHLDKEVLEKYLKSQQSLHQGILFDIIQEPNKTLLESLKMTIKNNIAMGDGLFLNELISFPYHVADQSELLFRLESFNGASTFFQEGDSFDHLTQRIEREINWQDITLEGHISLVLKVKVLKKNSRHEAFDQMLATGKFSESYLKFIVSELVKSLGVRNGFNLMMDKQPFQFDQSISYLEHLASNQADKILLKKYLNTKDLLPLFFITSHNYWDNSNF